MPGQTGVEGEAAVEYGGEGHLTEQAVESVDVEACQRR